MLLNIQIVLSILLIIVVLLQNKNVSLNLSSMSSDMWEITKRWPEKILQNTTIILWVAFVVNSILLFIS
jgi:protein translocase SecG subunit